MTKWETMATGLPGSGGQLARYELDRQTAAVGVVEPQFGKAGTFELAAGSELED